MFPPLNGFETMGVGTPAPRRIAAPAMANERREWLQPRLRERRAGDRGEHQQRDHKSSLVDEAKDQAEQCELKRVIAGVDQPQAERAALEEIVDAERRPHPAQP